MRTRQTALPCVAAVLLTLVAGCGTGSSNSATPPSSSGPTGHASPSHIGHTRSAPSPSVPHATEFNPPGDIPDNAVFVDHTAPGSQVHFTVPEGWAKSTAGGVTTFTDKYNSISIGVVPAKRAPTEKTTRRRDVPQLRTSVSHFSLESIGRVTTQHGVAVHLVYGLDSKPNPVTGKVVRDTAERFEFWRQGQESDLTLTGPVNADNVDPWRIVSDSLQWK
jgi:hypothetical protein